MKNKGFTLLELLIALAIIAILASFAIPSYQDYVLRGRRVEARNALQEIQQKLEQNYSLSRNWARTPGASSDDIDNTTIVNWGLNNIPVGSSGSRVMFQVSFEETPNENGYKLKALAVNAQAKDVCRSFYINQSGVKQAAKKDGAIKSSRDQISIECWGR